MEQKIMLNTFFWYQPIKLIANEKHIDAREDDFYFTDWKKVTK